MAPGDTLQGRRIPDSEWFERRTANELQPGDYGVEFITREGEEVRDWFVRCPNGADTVLWVNEADRNGNRHVIEEHDDGTITVHGSIMGEFVRSEKISGAGPISSPGWHGWLEHGVWREA